MRQNSTNHMNCVWIVDYCLHRLGLACYILFFTEKSLTVQKGCLGGAALAMSTYAVRMTEKTKGSRRARIEKQQRSRRSRLQPDSQRHSVESPVNTHISCVLLLQILLPRNQWMPITRQSKLFHRNIRELFILLLAKILCGTRGWHE